MYTVTPTWTTTRHAAATAIAPAATERRHAAAGGQARVWGLPHRPQSASAARRITRATLTRWDLDEDTIDQALLVVSELVTNAVEHALPPVALHIERPARGDSVHIEVDDGGPAPVEGAWTTSCAPEEHGRGNALVAALATDHGIRELPDGLAHWADLATA
ncbi:ATP-binding protein [Streptomyces sp. NPDC051582]|uniref:ATP-binding protein n=1 Tax=Streptomyces sp. NPDC051582 TaxID=3155167 RepID=UPI003436046B